MPHLPNHRRSLPILLTASMALIAAACVPGISQAVLGDRVWGDGNLNGIQDLGEPGAAGVTVSLYQEDGALVDSTTTDDLGAYQFAGLRSGRYFLAFLALEGKPFTLDNTGDDDEADSDADGLTGRTEVFDFDSSQPDLRWDAGLVLYAPTATPQPPLPPRLETPTPTSTPVVPTTGGTYEIRAFFVLDEGACGGPTEYQDTLVFDIAAGGQTSNSRQPSTGNLNNGNVFSIVIVQATVVGPTITVRQPSTGDVNTGMIQPDGTFEVSSPRESYSGKLEFVRDEAGKIVRVILRATNTYKDAKDCVAKYKVEGEAEIEGD